MKVSTNGTTLVIEINLDENEGETSNGNTMIASTRGWQKIDKGVSLNLNLVRKTGA